jgi:2-C-methyl-D-erythritol 4-phosphate cytidylyltransferase
LQQYAVIVAGGSGSRMGGEIPKQFLLLNGLPILFRSINAFVNYNSQINIVVVAPKAHVQTIYNLKRQHNFSQDFTLVDGGATRFLSVKNGLREVPNNCLVGIHDAVRPLVSKETLQKAFDSAEQKGNGIPAIGVFDSLRKVKENKNKAVDRNLYQIIQTPQVFKSSLIKEAFAEATKTDFSDDATVFEAFGKSIFLTEGNRENIKITTPVDLKIAEALF